MIFAIVCLLVCVGAAAVVYHETRSLPLSLCFIGVGIAAIVRI